MSATYSARDFASIAAGWKEHEAIALRAGEIEGHGAQPSVAAIAKLEPFGEHIDNEGLALELLHDYAAGHRQAGIVAGRE
jgi:hypothetical protein